MREEKKQLLSTLAESYRDALEDLSLRIGIQPSALDEVPETTGSGGMYAAMIGIKSPQLRVTVAIIVDEPVVTGGYFQNYADLRGELLDDEIALFSEFADSLTQAAFEKAGVGDLDFPPCHIIGGENFRNVPSNKSAVISFSLPFALKEGRIFINVSIHA